MNQAPSGLPPGPRMPVALQTGIWFRRAQWFMSQCAARFGETFTVRIFHEGSWVMLSNPQHVKQVFTGDPKVFHAGEGNRVLLPILGPNSLLLLGEGDHMEQRKLLLPPFHGERMQRYGGLIREIAADEIERWPTGEPYRLRPRMQAITLEIILRAVFGLEHGRRLEELRYELRRLLDLLTQPQMLLLPMLLGPERLARMALFHRLHARVDELIYEEVAERRRAPDLHAREDILSMLLDARHEQDDLRSAQSGEAGRRARGKRKGSPMSDEEVRDQLLTLLTAGHETTATALSWAVERLIRHPDKLARLTEEVDAGESRYLEAVVTETLRLRPVISIVARRLREDVEIGGWQLPAGVTVAPSIYLVHRRPEIYPDPERFEPERFLDGYQQPDDPGAAQLSEAGGRAGGKPGTYTWIPFGGGVRRCIGGSFAHFEMQVVLAELVRRRRLRPTRQESERVFRRAITETPRHDAEVVLA